MSTAQAPSARFGALLKHYRRTAGLTQEALAEQARLSVRGIQDLERGVSQAPRPDTVALLAEALGLSPAERSALVAAAHRPPRARAQLAPSVPVSVAAGALVPLVGRQRELALLQQFLAGDRGPTAPLLVLAGEPGIGKSRLLQAAAQQGITHGWTVLAGGCHRRGGQEPYAPLLAALAQYLHAPPPERLRAALVGCAWLVRLLPELADVLAPLPTGTLAPEQERRLLFAAVARVLGNVAGPAGTLLVLDDLQWAGSDALDLLATLVRAPTLAHRERGVGGAGVLRIVGAYRDTEVRAADPLGLLLADLAQAGLAQHHALGPLAKEEAAALLDDLLANLANVAGRDQAVVAQVLERAGGTPFFLVSYAQALRTGSGEVADTVPWDLAQGVRQRVALLPAAGQEVLGAAAVVGRRAPRALLVAAVGQPEEAVLAGLEVACRARLLLEEGEATYVFAHDVIREVVEAEVGAARRALLHRRVADALEGGATAPADLLAYHYARGGAVDKAVPYLEQAGDEAWAQRAHGAAERHYREVVDRLEALGRAQEVRGVCEKLGEVLYQTGHYGAAIQVLEQAAAAHRAAGDLNSLGRVTARIGWAHSLRGTPQEGVARLTMLLEVLDQSGASPPQAALHEALGQLLFAVGQYDASLAASDRAAALARTEGDKRTRVLADEHRLNLLQLLGRLGDAWRVGQEVLPLAEALGDRECLLQVYRDLAYIHTLQGAFETGRGSIARALAVAEQMSDPGQLALTLAFRGWIALLDGDWPDAHADLDRAQALSRQVDQSVFSQYVLVLLARLSLAEGGWAPARVAVQEALALAERCDDLQALRWASAVMAELDVVEGRPEAASARLVPLLDRPGLEECDVTLLLPVLAWAYLEQGQVEHAAATVEQALGRARREEMRLVLVEALRVQALIALRQEQWAEAACSLEEGVALARRMPYPYAEARLLHVGGQLHAALGEPELARERLQAALALCQRLGARRDIPRVEQALASLPQNPSLFQNPLPSANRSLRSPQTRVSDAQWATIEALLPPPARTGRPRVDDRQTLEAILYKLDMGCAWSAVPVALGDGVTAHRRLRAWQAAGLWAQIQAIVQDDLA